MTFDITDERRKRHRRTANEIHRHYPCPVEECPKSYGSEGSLNQHLKLKHPEYYQAQLQASNATQHMMPGVLSQSSGQKVVGLSAVSLTSNKQSDGGTGMAKKPQAMAASQQSGQSQLSQNNNEDDGEESLKGSKIPATDKQKYTTNSTAVKAGGEAAAGMGTTAKSGASKKQSNQQVPGE